MANLTRMKQLIEILNDATKAYDEGKPFMSDIDWDEKYYELQKLEEESDILFPNSPTQSIQYDVVNSLSKVTHNHKMLSLDKTKSEDEVKAFLGSNDWVAMLKMDGLTCSLTYQDGKLVRAETRGNGIEGEDITHNAKVIPSIPKSINIPGEIVVDGEIICDKETFKQFEGEYKNPRNFASGSIRLLDSNECGRRGLTFIAWDLITPIIDPFTNKETFNHKLDVLNDIGFTVVLHANKEWGASFEHIKKDLVSLAEAMGYPIDGLVFKFDDCVFGRSLGETGHHFKNAIALKFYDEEYETTLIDIDWQVGRTGIITPVAAFEPIDMDGSTVERASLHNLNIMGELLGTPYRGQKVWVYKANQIIPQIIRSEHGEGDTIPQPEVCPLCGEPVIIKNDTDSRFLFCSNSACSGKFINVLDHFAGKSGLDIKGLSKSTLEKLMDWGWVNSITDLFKLQEHRSEWIQRPGFGVKSVDNILAAVQTSRSCDLDKFICALGIPLIGRTAAKALANHFSSWNEFIGAIENEQDFSTLPNFGYEMNRAIYNFDFTEAKAIANDFIIFKEAVVNSAEQKSDLAGKTFVVTGKVHIFKNRDELKSIIESLGGKVTGSVSNNTNFLINNDTASTSAKNLKAKQLGIPILSEEDFIDIFHVST